MIQALAIIIIIVLVLLFVHYVLFEGDSVEGIKRVAYGGCFLSAVVLGWILLAALIILLLAAAFGAFNHC